MRVIFLDENFIAYNEDNPAAPRQRIESENLAYVDLTEGTIRYVPEGQTWTREDGTVFQGLMITKVQPTKE